MFENLFTTGTTKQPTTGGNQFAGLFDTPKDETKKIEYPTSQIPSSSTKKTAQELFKPSTIYGKPYNYPAEPLKLPELPKYAEFKGMSPEQIVQTSISKVAQTASNIGKSIILSIPEAFYQGTKALFERGDTREENLKDPVLKTTYDRIKKQKGEKAAEEFINPVDGSIRKELDDKINDLINKPVVKFSNEVLSALDSRQQVLLKDIFDEKEGLSNPAEYAYTIASGAVSLAEAVGLYALTKNSNIVAGVLSTMEATSTYRDARAKGKTPEEARKIMAQSGMGTFLLEKVGLDYLFRNKIGNRILEAAKTSVFETTQELGQTFWQNYVSQNYDKSVKVFDNWWETVVAIAIPSFVAGGFNYNKVNTQRTNLIKDVQNKTGATPDEAIKFVADLESAVENSAKSFVETTTEQEKEKATAYDAGKKLVDDRINNNEAVILDPDELKTITGKQETENHAVYSQAVNQILKESLSKVENPVVKWTAGSPGAGKTDFATNVIKEDFNGIIMDGTLANYNDFITRAKEVSNAGKENQVWAVISNPFTSWNYVNVRKAETGRGITVEGFVDRYLGAIETLKKVIQNNPEINVAIKDIRNIFTKDEALNSEFIDDPKQVLAILNEISYNRNNLIKDLNEQTKSTTEKGQLQEGGTKSEQAIKEARTSGKPSEISKEGRAVTGLSLEETIKKELDKVKPSEKKVVSATKEITLKNKKTGEEKTVILMEETPEGFMASKDTKEGAKLPLMYSKESWESTETPEELARRKIDESVESKLPKKKKTGKKLLLKGITKLETQLNDEYSKIDKDKYEKELGNIFLELEVSEKGERFMTEDGEFIGKKSSFPEWIPEQYRSKKLFNSIIEGLYGTIKYPDKNKSRQREFYDFLLDELDERLNIDTKEIRNNIIQNYDNIYKKQVEKISPDILEGSEDTFSKRILESKEWDQFFQREGITLKGEFITNEEALKILGEFPFVRDYNIKAKIVESLTTPDGQKALGKWTGKMIEFVNNPAKTTLPHEVGHGFISLMTTESERTTLYDEIRAKYEKQFTDQEAQEKLVEDFARYYVTKREERNILKRFYDWIIGAINRLLRRQTAIDRFYNDIQNKTPSKEQIEAFKKKLSDDTLNDVRFDYYQNPTGLTAKFLNLPPMKGRKTAGYQEMTNFLKNAPLKQAEKDIITAVLNTEQFQGKKKIDLQDFKEAIVSELMPLELIESNTYASYGANAVGLSDAEHKTYIFNSPFNHGRSGHFTGDFQKIVNIGDVEIRKIPTTEKWAVVKYGVELTKDNIEQNVYNVSGSKEEAKKWIDKHTINHETVDIGQIGLFGHVRTFDEINEETENVDLSYIGEIQSDTFQGGRVPSKETKLKELENDIKEYTDSIERAEKEINLQKAIISDIKKGEIKVVNEEYDIAERNDVIKREIDTIARGNLNIKMVERDIETLKNTVIPRPEKQFFSYKNIWHERMIKEIIRLKAMEGVKFLRFPTPHSVAKIEGYLGEENMPYEIINAQNNLELSVGDTIDYGGEELEVVEATSSYIKAAETEKVHSFSKDAYQDDEWNYQEETIYDEFNDLKKHFGEVDTPEKAKEVITLINEINNYFIWKKAPQKLKEFEAITDKKNWELNQIDIAKEIITKGEPKKPNVNSVLLDYEYNLSYEIDQVLNYMAYDELSLDDAIEKYHDLFNQNWEFDEGSIDAEEVFYDGDNVTYVENGAIIESFDQPGYYADIDQEDPEVFNKEYEDSGSLNKEAKTVLRFYDDKVIDYLKKIRKDLKLVNEADTQWYETEITPEDKADVEAFQTEKSLTDDYVIPAESLTDKFRRLVQDKNTRIERIMNSLRDFGGIVQEATDVFLAKTLLPKRIGAKIDTFKKNVRVPFIKEMVDLGIEFEELDLYLHAKHAPERNAKIMDKFDKENGSGMSNERALEILDKAKKDGKLEALEGLRLKLAAISKGKLNYEIAEGLTSEEEARMIEGAYKYYVPLGREMDVYTKGLGKGVDIRGKENKRAKGSMRKVLPITAQIFNKMEKSIIRAEKNKVGLTLKKLIEANPLPVLWNVKGQKFMPVYDEFGEILFYQPEMKLADNVIGVKENGKQFLITINDPLLAQALKDSNMTHGISFMRTPISILSQSSTKFNPEFLLRNFQRDLFEGLMNLQGIKQLQLNKESQKKLSGDVTKNLPSVIKGVWDNSRGNANTKWDSTIQRFKDAGGEVGHFWLDTEVNVMKDLQREYKQIKNIGFEKVVNGARFARDIIEDANTAIELGIRVSAFDQLTKRGMSDKRAAEIAGDLTVDFNKEGELGPLLKSLYMFINPAIQGTARVYRGAKTSSAVRGAILGMVAGGFINGLISIMLGGEGDDDIPEYTKNTSIVISIPDGKEIGLFKLPYGFNSFWALGRNLSSFAMGRKTWDEAAINTAIAAIDSFNPLSGSKFSLASLAPTPVKPVVDVSLNEGWYGSPIMPDQPRYGAKIPESQRFFKGVSEGSKFITQWLNRITGGNDKLSGMIDLSPEAIDYGIAQYTGGVGTFIKNTGEVLATFARGEIPAPEKIPFVRDYFRNTDIARQKKTKVYDTLDESARHTFTGQKRQRLLNDITTLEKRGDFDSETANDLRIEYLKNTYHFTLGNTKEERYKALEVISNMSSEDIKLFWNSLTDRQRSLLESL